MKTTENKAFRYIFVFLFIIVLFAAFASYFYYKSDNAVGPNLITAFVGVVLSALVTLVLLNGQTKDEEYKEKNVRIFQRKQRCYSEFINKLWACKSKDDFEKVEESMRELIFVVNTDKLEDLTEYLKTAKKDCETFDKASESYAKITKLLRDDLYADSIEDKEIKAIFDACHYEPEKEQEEDKHVEKRENIDELNMHNPQIQSIWEKYQNEDLQCWHFNAFDVEKQSEALNKGNMILSLIEYDEDWRTQRLKEVKAGDVVFLFNRGGAGYVGMYRAKGTVIISVNEEGCFLSDSQEGVEKKISEDEGRMFDIYDAIEDGATSVASISVEPIIIPKKNTYNPIGTMRQTIVRPSYDNVYALLNYFDEQSEKEEK